jgi:hypothetical protein
MQRWLAQELVLLGLDDAGRVRASNPQFDFALAGAVLLDLTMAGRIGVQDGRLVVTDPQPLGDAVHDEALVAIGGRRGPAKQWVRRLSKGLRRQLVDQLVAGGTLRAEPGRAWGLFRAIRHPVADPAVVAGLQQQVRAAVNRGSQSEPHTAALCALVRAAGLERRLFPDQPMREVRRRLDEVGAGGVATDAVQAAIREVRAAMVASVTASSAGS